jgi:hypothetical protein
MLPRTIRQNVKGDPFDISKRKRRPGIQEKRDDGAVVGAGRTCVCNLREGKRRPQRTNNILPRLLVD